MDFDDSSALHTKDDFLCVAGFRYVGLRYVTHPLSGRMGIL